MNATAKPPSPQGALLSKALCRANRTDGAPCAAPPGDGELCFFHDPDRLQERLAAARRGGSRKALPLPTGEPLGAAAARGVLAAVLAGLLQGSVDPTTARAAAYILQVERKIAEGEEMERRISAIEALMPGGNGKTAWHR